MSVCIRLEARCEIEGCQMRREFTAPLAALAARASGLHAAASAPLDPLPKGWACLEGPQGSEWWETHVIACASHRAKLTAQGWGVIYEGNC